MRVLYIADPGSVGGAARALIEVVMNMKTLGVEPIVCTSIYDDLNKKLESMNIHNFACGHKSAMNTKSPYKWKRPLKYPYELIQYYCSLPRAIRNIEKEIDLKSVDLVHTNSARNDIGCIINKKYGIPHIIHIREFGQEDFNCCIYRPQYYKYLNKHCTIFLAVSKAIEKSWISKGLDKNKIQVLYDGVDVENIDIKETYERLRKLRIIIAGGVCEAKGQHIAIKAMGNLKPEIKKNVFLDIAGWTDPQYVDKLKLIIQDYGLEKQVRLLGIRNDLYSILKDYDIGLMCSKSEGFGRVTVEYMYAGLCVIGTDTGATPELIEDGKTGMLFKYACPEELTRCIEKSYIEYENRIAIGAGAHCKAKYYSSWRNANDIYCVYEQIFRRN